MLKISRYRILMDTLDGEYYQGPEVKIHISKEDIQSLATLDDITKIYIPDHVESIEAGAFAGCTNLADVEIYGNVEDIHWSTNPRGAWKVSLDKNGLIEKLREGEGTIQIVRTHSWD